MNGSTANYASENEDQKTQNNSLQSTNQWEEKIHKWQGKIHKLKMNAKKREMNEEYEIKQFMIQQAIEQKAFEKNFQLPSTTYASTVNKKAVQPILNKMEVNRLVNVYESYKKAKALPEDVPIYLYSGHGTDICQEDDTPVIKVVPDNCIYITFTTCGKILSAKMKHILQQFHTKNANITKMLKTPYLPGNKQNIANFFGQNEEDVHIHYPGMTYIENMFYPLASYETEFTRYIQNSGLLEKSTFEEDKLIQEEYNFTDSEGQIIDLVRSLKLKKYIEYRDSFTKNDVIQMVNKYYADKKNMNLVSKGILKKKAYEMVESLYKQNKLHHINKVNLMFWEIVSNEMYKKSTIPSLFKSSVKPTETFMKIALGPNFIGKNFPDADILSDDARHFLNLMIREKNSDLMNKFPGIHIAHICRNVNPTCEQQANFRRVMSKQQENIREAINVNEKQIVFYDLLGKILKNKDQINSILDENKDYISSLNNSSKENLFKYIMSHLNASRKNNIKKKIGLPNTNISQKGGIRKTRKNKEFFSNVEV